MRKWIIFFGVISLLTGLMSGCAKKEKAEAKKENVSVVKIHWVVGSAPTRKYEIAGFYKDPSSKGIVVEPDMRSDNPKAILSMIESGNPPDLFSIYSPADMLLYMEKEALLDLSPYMRRYKLDPGNFWTALKPYMQYKGKVYGFPSNCSPFVLFYNKKMFDESGILYPNKHWTWKDLLEAAKKLTKKDKKTGRYTQFGLLSEDPDMFIWQNGGWYYTKDGKKCIINSPEAKWAFRWYYDLRFTHNVMPTPSEVQSLSAHGGGDGSLNLFAAEKVAMFIQGRGMVRILRKNKILDWNIAPVPRGKHKVTKIVSRTYAIPRNCKHKYEAFKFLNYLIGPGQYIIVKSGDGIPSRISMCNSKEFLLDKDFPEEDRNKIYLDEMIYARAPEYSPYVSEIEANRIWQEEINLCWNKKQSPDETLNKIAARINKIIQQNLAKKKQK